jgi:hypothetical protein
MMTDTPPSQSLITNPGSTLFLISVIVLAVRLELGRRSEMVFLSNLGHSFRGIALVVVAECLVLEAGLRVAIG